MSVNEPAPQRSARAWDVARHFFLTSKPYSYVQEISRGILLALLLGASTPWPSIWLPGLLSWLMWLYFNWQSDYLQCNAGRIRPPRLLCATPLVLTCLILFVDHRFLGIAAVGGYALTIALYAQKAIHPWVGTWGPLLRALTILGHGGMVCSALESPPNQHFVLVLGMLTLLHSARNLVGDVRDIERDEFEIPARFGARVSLWVLRALLLAATIACSLATRELAISPWPVVIVAGAWGLLELLARRFAAAPAQWGYFGHRMSVVANTVLNLALAWDAGLSQDGIVVLALATLALQGAYGFLPGKSFPPLSALWEAKPIVPDQGEKRSGS